MEIFTNRMQRIAAGILAQNGASHENYIPVIDHLLFNMLRNIEGIVSTGAVPANGPRLREIGRFADVVVIESRSILSLLHDPSPHRYDPDQISLTLTKMRNAAVAQARHGMNGVGKAGLFMVNNIIDMPEPMTSSPHQCIEWLRMCVLRIQAAVNLAKEIGETRVRQLHGMNQVFTELESDPLLPAFHVARVIEVGAWSMGALAFEATDQTWEVDK